MRAATRVLAASPAVLTRSFASKPKIQVAIDKNKVHETPIVQNCGGDFMRWMGPGSRFQMYCALLLSGSLVYQADASANMMEVLATSGAICSASATVFFGAKRLCDKVVTDIVSCRKVGDANEFVRVSVLGVGVKEVLEAAPKDFKLLGHDGKDAYSFALGGRRLQLDTSAGECVNRKALDMLMQGRPLVTRKVNQGKKRSRSKTLELPKFEMITSFVRGVMDCAVRCALELFPHEPRQDRYIDESSSVFAYHPVHSAPETALKTILLGDNREMVDEVADGIMKMKRFRDAGDCVAFLHIPIEEVESYGRPPVCGIIVLNDMMYPLVCTVEGA